MAIIKPLIQELYPDFLRGNKNYKVFIDMSANELSDVHDFVESLNTLINIDRVPAEFIASLGKLIDFNYLSENNTIDRELMKCFFMESKRKGALADISYASTYADEEGYLIGRLHDPSKYKAKPLNTLVMARECLFRHGYSIRGSANTIYPENNVYREGILIIDVSKAPTDKTIHHVERVKPAGVRVVYKLSKGDGTFEYLSPLKETLF